MHRYDLTDAQWRLIEPFFPDRYHHGGAGHPWNDHRPLVNGILWHLHTGAPWPDTPERYGPWQTVYDRFNRWRQDGTWARILDALLLRLDKSRAHRPRPVVRRCLRHPRQPGRRRGEKKIRDRRPRLGGPRADANAGAA